MILLTYIIIYIYIYNIYTQIYRYLLFIYRVSQEECARLRQDVPFVKIYRYNPKHPMSKFERLRR